VVPFRPGDTPRHAIMSLPLDHPHIKHVSITTTSEYIEIDMAMKRKAIERCPPLVPDPEGETRWHASKDIIQWLEDL
jgi:hypothetical protein